MSVPVILRPAAQADVQDIQDAFDARSTTQGDHFTSRLRQTLDTLRDFPELFGFIWQDVRAAPIKKFKHQVIYVAFPDRVEVLAVRHGSRGSTAWQARR